MACRPPQPLNYYYGSLLTQHLKAILESGLLLDEDYEVLLNGCNFKIYPTHSGNGPLRIIAASVAVIGSTMAAWKCNNVALALSSLGALVLVYLERKATLKRKQRQRIVDEVIKSFGKVRKLNTAIIRYLKLRKSGKSTKENLLVEHNENVREFVIFFSRRNQEYLNMFMGNLKELASKKPELSEDFRGVEDIDLESLLTQDDELTVSRIQDIFTLLVSKYLNYLGFIFCSSLHEPKPCLDIKAILDYKLPLIQSNLTQLNTDIQQEFNNLRYCAAEKVAIDTTKKGYYAQKLSGKLHQTLIGAVNNLSLITEKSQLVLRKIEQIEDNSDVKKLEMTLRDLRDHAFATYESLEILCKLYGVLANAPKGSTEVLKASKPKEEESPLTINYDDQQEVIEEDYELFIPDVDTETTQLNIQQEQCQDQSGAYLGLMLKELRQALKEHDRFIAARNKRGIQDEDVPPKAPKEVAKFDLRGFNSPKAPVPPPRPSKIPPPTLLSTPPPPPPPPRVLEEEAPSGPTRSLFDGIKALSSQLNCEEEVFGDEEDSD